MPMRPRDVCVARFFRVKRRRRWLRRGNALFRTFAKGGFLHRKRLPFAASNVTFQGVKGYLLQKRWQSPSCRIPTTHQLQTRVMAERFGLFTDIHIKIF